MPKKISRKIFKKKSMKLRRKTQKRNKKKMRGGSVFGYGGTPGSRRSSIRRSPGSRSRSPPRERSPERSRSRSRTPHGRSPGSRSRSPPRERSHERSRSRTPHGRSPGSRSSRRQQRYSGAYKLKMERVYKMVYNEINKDKLKLQTLKEMTKKGIYQKVFGKQIEQMISDPDELVAELIPVGTEEKYKGSAYKKARAYIAFCRRFSEFNTHEDFLKGLGKITQPDSQTEHNERARDGYLLVELVWGLRQDVGRSLGKSEILDKIQSVKIRGDFLKSRKLFFLYYTVLYLIFILGFNHEDAKVHAKELMKQNQEEIIKIASHISYLDEDKIKKLAEELMVDIDNEELPIE